jgi:phosphotriesterase-related protein
VQAAGLPADRMIWVHAQNGTDAERIELARQGVWISLDGVGAGQVANYVERVLALKNAGLLSRVLISHDDGWSVDDEAGTIRLNYFKAAGTPYRTIEEELIPQLLAAGLTPAEVDGLLIEQPRQAYTIER